MTAALGLDPRYEDLDAARDPTETQLSEWLTLVQSPTPEELIPRSAL